MNKKFLSAILFGALMVTSTGTFVSCKDYDDDIKGLQTQIDANKNAIAELQKLVGSGNWVTNVAASGSDLVVTMSNGSTVTVAGVKGADGKDGVDGKNAAEWTIGEDGFWYMDGEKTDKVAVAQNGKDGKDGVTAPSPSIENGMWVVYNWDATKGEFVKEVTDVPAAGTSAFAVKVDGVWTLNVADENGEFVEIALPATSDSFVVEALANEVNVEFEIATWKNWTAKIAKSDEGKALLAKYPEIAELEKNAPMKQGGMLPVIATPANVDLADGFEFYLQDVYGKVADIELSDAVKGAGNLAWGDVKKGEDADALYSRAAEDACLWSLAVEPAYDTKKKDYATAVKTSLVAENAKGTVARTAFAYTLIPFNYDEKSQVNVSINTNNGSWSETDAKTGKVLRSGLGSWAPYAESIDLFEGVLKNGETTVSYPISFSYDYNNHYVIVLNDALQAEEYGLSIAEDGHTLNIAKMPASKLTIEVELKVIALGLNGSVDSDIVKLTVGQEIAETGLLSDKEITLGYTEKNGYDKYVRWNIADELKGFTATQLNQFLSSDLKLSWSYVNEDGDEVTTIEYTDENGTKKSIPNPITLTAYDKDGKSNNVTYKNAVTFGFTVDSRYWLPEEYDINLTATSNGSVVYNATATLTVNNPGTTAIKLVPEFVENGVLQVVGSYNSTSKMITYNLNNGVILGDKISIVKFEDVDYQEYVELYGTPTKDDTDMASENWIAETEKTIGTSKVKVYETLSINPYAEATAETTPDVSAQLETVRNIRATYCLFGNENNTETFDFQVIVKSAVYSETPAEVVTITKTALDLKLIDPNGEDDADPTKVDLAKITKAVLAYGPKAGEAYTLWNSGGSTGKKDNKKYHNDYANPNKVDAGANDYGFGQYVINSNDLMIEIAESDLSKFGYNAAQIMAAQQDGKKYFISYDQTLEYTVTEKDEEGKDITVTKTRQDLVTWKEIWDKVITLTAPVLQSDGVTSKDESVIVAVKHTNYKDEKTSGYGSEVQGAWALNTAACDAYIANNPGTTEAIYCYLFKTYYSQIAYPQITEVYETFDQPASGRSAYLTEDAKIEFVDATTGDKFVNLTGTTIQAALETGVDMTSEKVEVPFKLTIKDVWGKTMVVPFTVTVNK